MVKKRDYVDKSAIAAAHSQAFLPGTPVWAPATSPTARRISSSHGIVSWARGVVEGVSRGVDDVVVLDVLFDDGSRSQLRASECFLQNEKDDTVDDLVRSDFLHEPGILHTLRVRYELDMIYTYSGKILIAVNPQKPLKHLYGSRMMAQYKGIPFGDLSPHTYAVAEAAYSAMMIDEKRQTILISGESGAGKTESAKMVMQYLAHRSGSKFGDIIGSAAPIEEQILESNPLLEAFGNAKTVRNDNSSRFGKFVEIDFDPTGRVAGANISTYLLERSRIVSIGSPERSFHIFYQIFYGASDDLRKRLYLPGDISEFRYLGQSSTVKLDGIDDKDGFVATLNAMKVIGLDGNEIESVLRCVGAVLHLGNISFVTAENAMADEAVVSPDDRSIAGLQAAAALLGTTPEKLSESLMKRTISTAGEKIEKRYNIVESEESRDSLAKSLYSKLFDWLVSAVNKKIGSVGGSRRTPLSVGILDIYGFESFDTNSFEQLCINLANEKLQQAFNAHVFKAEQEEYAIEGIDWSYIEFIDNQDVLDLLEGTRLSSITKENLNGKNLGIFPMLDEACRLPKATFQDLAISLRSKLEKHPRFSAPKRDQFSFIVNHYAGEVRYATDGFLEKNRDFIVEDQEALMRSCDEPLPRNLYLEYNDRDRKKRNAFKLNTIGSTFQKQLNKLSDTLNACQPHFIRCIKPNEDSTPGNLQTAYAMGQLRAGGVLEAVRIACAGYPTRKTFLPFAKRYSVLLSHHDLESSKVPTTGKGLIDWHALQGHQVSDLVVAIMKRSSLSGWQIGRTKIFLRTGQLAALEGQRGKIISNAVLKIQSYWRSYQARRRFKIKVQAIIIAQSAWRSYFARTEARRIRIERAAKIIQSQWRSYRAQKVLSQRKRQANAIVIQACWRMYSARKSFIKQSEFAKLRIEVELLAKAHSEAATLIQAHWRRYSAWKVAKRLSITASKFSALEEEIRSLKNVLKTKCAENESLKQDRLSDKSRISNLEKEVSRLSILQDNSLSSFAEKRLNEIKSLCAKYEESIATLSNEMACVRQRLVSSEEEKEKAEKAVDTQAQEINSLLDQNRKLNEDLDSLEQQNEQLKEKIRELERGNASNLMEIENFKLQAESTDKSSQHLKEVHSLKLDLQNLHRQLFEKDNSVMELRNENTVLSSRIQSLMKEVEVHAQEKSSLTFEITQLKEYIEKYREHERIEKDESGKVVTIGDLTNNPTVCLEDTNPVDMEADTHGLLDESKIEAINLIISQFITEKSVYVTIRNDIFNCGAILPYGSWIIRRCMNHWAGLWSQSQVTQAMDQIMVAISQEARKSFNTCLYCVILICSSGAMLKVESVGRKESALFVKTSEKLIGLDPVYESLAHFVTEKIPIHIPSLLAEDARRSARASFLKKGSNSFENQLEALGTSKSQWIRIIGTLTNLAVILKEENVPNALSKAIIWAAMRFVDGTILNGLLLRRDLCSVSSAKALQTALGILENHMTTRLADGLNFSPDEFGDAFQRLMQASYFIMEGFDDLTRKTKSGVNILSSISRMSALTLQQVYRLAEFQHDDWRSEFRMDRERKSLLENLKMLSENPGTASVCDEYENNLFRTPTKSWTTFGDRDEDVSVPAAIGVELAPSTDDVDNLLVDPSLDFYLNARGFTRRQVMLNNKMYFNVAPTLPTGPGPLLPDGTRPQTSPGAIDLGNDSFFSKIDDSCRKVPIPPAILKSEGLHFLTSA